MKEEARFQIRGTVKDSANRSTERWIIQELRITVTHPNGEASAPLQVDCFGDDLVAVARSLRLGQQVLVLGRLHCRLNKNGYPDLRLRADALMVEPGTERTHGAADPAAASAAARGASYGATSASPLPMPHEEDDDIPF